MSQKATELQQVIYGFGLLIQPLKELCERTTPATQADYRVAVAKVRGGVSEWQHSVKQLTTFGPDLRLDNESAEISVAVGSLLDGVKRILNWRDQGDAAAAQERLRGAIEVTERRFFKAVNQVPIDWEPSILPANTPFTTYRRISEAIAPATVRLHYFDRYLARSFFDLFLDPIRMDLEIIVVTTQVGVKQVASVSKLFAGEHSDYRLIEVDPHWFHDRNLRVDDRVFTIGPGADRAGVALTNFGPAEDSSAAHSGLDRLIAQGHVVHESNRR